MTDVAVRKQISFVKKKCNTVVTNSKINSDRQFMSGLSMHAATSDVRSLATTRATAVREVDDDGARVIHARIGSQFKCHVDIRRSSRTKTSGYDSYGNLRLRVHAIMMPRTRRSTYIFLHSLTSHAAPGPGPRDTVTSSPRSCHPFQQSQFRNQSRVTNKTLSWQRRTRTVNSK